MKKTICAITLGVILAGCQATESISSNPPSEPTQPACLELAGTWTGTKVGSGYQGAVTIPMNDNCTYEWLGSNGRITTGRLTPTDDGFRYANSAGSRGVVTVAGNTMNWVNVFTGNNYEVNVSK